MNQGSQGGYAVLLRSYAKKEADVAEVVKRALKSVRHCLINLDPDLIRQVVVLVPADKDCGKTADLIKTGVLNEQDQLLYRMRDKVSVRSLSGQPEKEVLNYGLELAMASNCVHALIVSNKAIAMLDNAVLVGVDKAFKNGAKIVGVALDELGDIVRAGRVQNTLAAWDIKALLEVGGFTSDIGVEEASASVELVKKYGPCIGVIELPSVRQSALDLRSSSEAQAEHAKILYTKTDRQRHEVERVGGSFELLKSGIMAGYPKSI